MTVSIFDTTLRDGEQSEGISLTIQDKLRISTLLDNLGIDYIEGGWPYSNPKAIQYFKDVRKLGLEHSKIVAFGSTRKAKNKAEDDPNLNAIIKANPDIPCIFGKTWDFHVTEALKISLQDNLLLIEDSIAYLKKNFKEVFFDAEHFFDGYQNNPEYAVKCLKAAEKGGADILILCDTNGGTLPYEIAKIIKALKQEISTPLGIHAHNDGECAVANSIMAVDQGCVQVQGTINGYGERCGNANLCSIISAVLLKMNKETSQKDKLKELTSTSRHISEIVNLAPDRHQAYVGHSAFSHKGGIHVNAILKNPETYEHINPKLVGNNQRVVVSDQSGLSNLRYKAKEYGIELDDNTDNINILLQKVKEMEDYGYQFEEGEASLELMLRRITKQYEHFFELIGFRVINDKYAENQCVIEATVKLTTDNGTIHTAGEGNGPISALDHAFRKALIGRYPEIEVIHLTDYKVRVLNSKSGTGSKVRVIIESTDNKETWGTVGVSTNIIEASWQALADSYEYKLFRSQMKK